MKLINSYKTSLTSLQALIPRSRQMCSYPTILIIVMLYRTVRQKIVFSRHPSQLSKLF